MSRNGEERGTTAVELVGSFERLVRSLLPSTWSVRHELHPRASGGQRLLETDAGVVVTAPDGTSVMVLVECKGVVVPRDVARIAKTLDAHAAAMSGHRIPVRGAVVATPFVTPTTRAQLDQHGIGWFDLTGNLRVRLDEPVVFLDRAGAERSGFRDPADRLLKSLRGPAAAKVVLELAETAVPVRVRELAERAEVGVATSARVLELLDREAAITRSEDGAVVAVRKRLLLKRWAQDYNVMTSNEVITTLDPRGLSHALKSLAGLKTPVVVTGSAAARAYLPDHVTPVSPIVSLTLYAEDPLELMKQLGLRAADRGANVLVMRPYDEVVQRRSRLVDGVEYAPPAQVVADLLTGPGRATEEAEQLMEALTLSEPGWEE